MANSLYPDWTPPWSKLVAVCPKAAAIKARKLTREEELMQKGVSSMGSKNKKKKVSNKELTENQRYYIDILVGKCLENNNVLPTKRQIEKDSFINSKEVLEILGGKGGWPEVFRLLRQELAKQGIAFAEAEDANKSKVGKASQQNHQHKVEASEPSDAAITSVIAADVTQVAETSSVEEPAETTPSDAQMQSFSYVVEVVEPKKRGRKPQEFDREEEIARLYRYYKMLGDRVPTAGLLQKLAKQLAADGSDEKVSAAPTFEKRIGPRATWPQLIADHEAKQRKQAAGATSDSA